MEQKKWVDEKQEKKNAELSVTKKNYKEKKGYLYDVFTTEWGWKKL
jgi:hypothetical protein